MSQQASGSGKGRQPPNPNNGSGNGVDNSNGVYNAGQTATAQTNNLPTMTGTNNPAVATASPAPGTMATPSTTGTPAYGGGTGTKGTAKGSAPAAPAGTASQQAAKSTYASTMAAALGTGAQPGQTTTPAGMAATAANAAAPTTTTPTTPAAGMAGQAAQPVAATTAPAGAALPNGQPAFGMGGKGSAKGINPGAPGGVATALQSLGVGQGSQNGQTNATGGSGADWLKPIDTTPLVKDDLGNKAMTVGFPRKETGGNWGRGTTDWAKVDPNQVRTPNGQVQVVTDPNTAFQFQPGGLGEKMANFTFKDANLEPWQKNWNALPPQYRLQYAASGQGAQGNEMIANALQQDGGFTKAQTNLFRNAFGSSGGSTYGDLGSDGLGIIRDEKGPSADAMGQGHVLMEGNTLFRVEGNGPSAKRVVLARLPYAQTMGRNANGAIGDTSNPNSYVGRMYTNQMAKIKAITDAGGNPNQSWYEKAQGR